MRKSHSGYASPFGARRVPFHFRMGIGYGYPICCVLHFCWDNALGRAAGMTRWKQISCVRSRSTYVPCGAFHCGDSPFSFTERIWRVLKFEWTYVLPTDRGRTLRQVASKGGRQYQESTIEERQSLNDQGQIERLWWRVDEE